MVRRNQSQENYLIFSDVHLGADLVQHAQPWTVAHLRRAARIDRELASMLDHYRERPDPERPWRLVIAGDLVDFIGMSIAPLPGDGLDSALTAEEREHGLGSTAEHAVAKMQAVARRPSLVFERLAAFVAAGNALVLVRGNHDVDFHWESARAAFVEAIAARLPGGPPDGAARAALEARIEFAPWFYYVEGLLYVEHGNQYDAMCSYLSPLVPLSPTDPKRIGWALPDPTPRGVVRPTRGLSAEGHDDLGALDYLAFAIRLGIRGAAKLFVRYAAAIAHMVRTSRAYVDERAAWLRAEHEAGVARMARRWQVAVGAIRELALLGATPTRARVADIFSSLLVDRLALVGVGALALGAIWLLGPGVWSKLGASAVILPLVAVFYVRFSRARHINATDALRRSAAHIARLFPARFVVMGHTHEPVRARVATDTTYFNLGSWAVDELELPEGAPIVAQRTHLVIRHIDGVACAELVQWDSERGPQAVLWPPSPDAG